MTAGSVLVGPCRCAEYPAGFVYRPEHNAWVFLDKNDVPPRSMTHRTILAVYIERRDMAHEDHTGERYTYQTCPFCGGDLKGVRYDGRHPGPFGGGSGAAPQGDGEG